jgi:uncharacterized protein YkwD
MIPLRVFPMTHAVLVMVPTRLARPVRAFLTSARTLLGLAMIGPALAACTPDAALTPQAAGVAPSLAGGCGEPAEAAALRAGLLAAVNARRRSESMVPLQEAPALRGAAMVVACDNAARGQMDHVTRQGADLRARLVGQGYAFRTAHEALAFGYRDPDRVAGVWRASAYHAPTLVNPVTREAGVAVVATASGQLWWAMIAAQPR